jgi:hypothetical protein
MNQGFAAGSIFGGTDGVGNHSLNDPGKLPRPVVWGPTAKKSNGRANARFLTGAATRNPQVRLCARIQSIVG